MSMMYPWPKYKKCKFVSVLYSQTGVPVPGISKTNLAYTEESNSGSNAPGSLCVPPTDNKSMLMHT